MENEQNNKEQNNQEPESKSILADLPKEIANEIIEHLNAQNSDVKNIRLEMIAKYPSVKELTASLASWYRWVNKISEQAGTRELAELLPSAENLEKAVDKAFFDPAASLSDRRGAMEGIFKDLKEAQSRVKRKITGMDGFINPDLEGIYISYNKALADIVNSTAKAQDVFNRDIEADMVKQMRLRQQQMFTLAYRAYLSTHPKTAEDCKFDLFRTTLEDLITEYLTTPTQPQK